MLTSISHRIHLLPSWIINLCVTHKDSWFHFPFYSFTESSSSHTSVDYAYPTKAALLATLAHVSNIVSQRKHWSRSVCLLRITSIRSRRLLQRHSFRRYWHSTTIQITFSSISQWPLRPVFCHTCIITYCKAEEMDRANGASLFSSEREYCGTPRIFTRSSKAFRDTKSNIVNYWWERRCSFKFKSLPEPKWEEQAQATKVLEGA